MFERNKYKDAGENAVFTDDHVASIKYDGANYFVPIDSQGRPRFFSRRESVKPGVGYPDRTESLPHLASARLPQYAGNVYNVELIHTGHDRANQESHRQVSGILNSLPDRSRAVQQALGPVRAVIHNVVNPVFARREDALTHMKEVADAWGAPDLVYVPSYARGPVAIKTMIDLTRRRGQEGVVVSSLSQRSDSPLIKVKHKVHFNLLVVGMTEAIDKHGQKKGVMGALEAADASGKVVASVGSGFSASQRKEAFAHPDLWIGRAIQVESMGFSAKRLRMPIYNGDADGDIDLVT